LIIKPNGMRYILLILLMLAIDVEGSMAQKNLSTKSKRANKLYQEAIANLNLLAYSNAIFNLNEAIAEDSSFIEAYILLGEVYTDTHNDSLAITSFKKSIDINPNFFPPLYSNLASLEHNNGLYSDALEHISKYLSYPTQNPKFRSSAEILVRSCRFALEAIKQPVAFNPQNMGPGINDEHDQYWPSISADGQTFVFTQLMPINPANPEPLHNRQEDFYISSWLDSSWTKARPVGPPLNTSKNEGAQTISADGKIMIYTGCNRRDGFGGCDLYISQNINDQWTVPKNMGPTVNSVAKETQPSISADGRTIYFSSNREGTKGGLDLWKLNCNDSDEWSEPINLGDSINTIFDEQSPYIHHDNHTLYFSSTGWPGMGRFDLFITRKISDSTWQTPKNLGYPINTHFSDEGLIVNATGNTAYYSSNRMGYGGRDIFSFELYKEIQPTSVSYMKGLVFDAETHAKLVANFELIDLATSNLIMNARSNPDGSFLVCIPAGKDYALNVNKKGYLFFSENFTMTGGDYSKPYFKDVPLEPIKVGSKVVMKNIFFNHDSYILKDESKVELQKLLSVLNQIKGLKIEISGHTDNTGTTDYNQKLSENRAKSVASYLISHGIEPARLKWKGYGEKQPIDSNETSEGKAKNRRTEFKVTGI
jgi:outer membrane protein OmpA-like peptidoglycan-associated protein/tetratricopeptide (TPR) repeat protein